MLHLSRGHQNVVPPKPPPSQTFRSVRHLPGPASLTPGNLRATFPLYVLLPLLWCQSTMYWSLLSHFISLIFPQDSSLLWYLPLGEKQFHSHPSRKQSISVQFLFSKELSTFSLSASTSCHPLNARVLVSVKALLPEDRTWLPNRSQQRLTPLLVRLLFLVNLSLLPWRLPPLTSVTLAHLWFLTFMMIPSLL